MPADDKETREYKNEDLEKLFNKIKEMSLMNRHLILEIIDKSKYMGLEINLPNIEITLNNKVVELQHEFKRAGISIYGSHKDLGASFVGDAIIFDLIANYANRGIQNLICCFEEMKEVITNQTEKDQELEKNSPIKSFFLRARVFFATFRPIEQEKINSITSHLSEYREIDEQLWNYNLRDNIISSIVELIRYNKYSAQILPDLLEACVVPDLEKLGLPGLLPQLQQTLIEGYKKDVDNAKTTNKFSVKNYIPDFSNKSNNPSAYNPGNNQIKNKTPRDDKFPDDQEK